MGPFIPAACRLRAYIRCVTFGGINQPKKHDYAPHATHASGLKGALLPDGEFSLTCIMEGIAEVVFRPWIWGALLVWGKSSSSPWINLEGFRLRLKLINHLVRVKYMLFLIDQWFPNWGPWPQGAMGLLPGSHGRILKKIYFSRIDTEIWTFGIFYPLKCNILEY